MTDLVIDPNVLSSLPPEVLAYFSQREAAAVAVATRTAGERASTNNNQRRPKFVYCFLSWMLTSNSLLSRHGSVDSEDQTDGIQNSTTVESIDDNTQSDSSSSDSSKSDSESSTDSESEKDDRRPTPPVPTPSPTSPLHRFSAPPRRQHPPSPPPSNNTHQAQLRRSSSVLPLPHPSISPRGRKRKRKSKSSTEEENPWGPTGRVLGRLALDPWTKMHEVVEAGIRVELTQLSRDQLPIVDWTDPHSYTKGYL